MQRSSFYFYLSLLACSSALGNLSIIALVAAITPLVKEHGTLDPEILPLGQASIQCHGFYPDPSPWPSQLLGP